MNVNKQIATYTKHYYIGSERIASSLGTGNSVGYYVCNPNFPIGNYTALLNQKISDAAQSLQDDYDYFEKQLTLNNPFTNRPSCTISHSRGQLNYWFHPDLPIIIGMGSSSYISNDNGEISQHLEYLPFGETLVEEHKNSNNSPYKFNGKELDDETGNYYYGARYLNPKWSFWLSVDPLAEKYPGWSPYNYTMLNPIRFVDPTGMFVEDVKSDGGCAYPPCDNNNGGHGYLGPDRSIVTPFFTESNNNYGGTTLDNNEKNSKSGSVFINASYGTDGPDGIHIDGIGSNNMGLNTGNSWVNIEAGEINGLTTPMPSNRFVRAWQALSKFAEILLKAPYKRGEEPIAIDRVEAIETPIKKNAEMIKYRVYEINNVSKSNKFRWYDTLVPPIDQINFLNESQLKKDSVTQMK